MILVPSKTSSSMQIHTDQHIPANKQVKDKKKETCLIIDDVIPWDQNFVPK